MAEYIDREALLQEISQQKAASKHSFPRRSFVVGDALTCIRTAPSADVAPVVHGKWEMNSDRPDTIICSNCDNAFDVWKHDHKRMSYCPNCGARMDLDTADNEQPIYKSALNKWGKENQTRMMFEEMAELQKELCKEARGEDNTDAIAEEIADVKIMLEQMIILHNCKDMVEMQMKRKLQRLKERLEGE